MTRQYTKSAWTEKQDALLFEFWADPLMTIGRAAQRLCMNEDAIKHRARSLKLGPKAEDKSAQIGTWTEPRIDLLKQLWAKGQSAAEISAALKGVVSRNAVIGKAARLGLTRSAASYKITTALGHRNIGVRSQAKAFGETRVPKLAPKPAPKLVVSANSAVFEQTDAEPVLPPVSVRAWSPLPGAEPIHRDQARSSACKWPITVNGDELAFCCGRRRDDGPYCGVHSAAAKPKAGAKEHLDRKLGLAPRTRAA